MVQHSAGLLLYRLRKAGPEVLLVHPGGPFWAKKDDGAWSIPKGLREADEDGLTTARREVGEETGFRPAGKFVPLGTFRQSGTKTVEVWAVEADAEPKDLKSNTFALEWPPKSGHMQEYPEVDRAAWLSLDEAARKILPGQRPILTAFLDWLSDSHEQGTANSMPSATYRLLRKAILGEKQVTCVYQGRHRELCPHIIGRTDGEEKVLAFQFGGESNTSLPPAGEWRCLYLSQVGKARIRDGPWHAGRRHRTRQSCVEDIDLDINVHVRKLRNS